MSRFQPSTPTALLISLGLLASASASAADLPARVTKAPLFVATPVATWEGFYAGTIFGAGLGVFKSSQASSHSVTKLGQTGGGLIGYNFQNGKYVYGLEGDITLDLIRTHNAGAVGLVSHDVDTLYTGRVRGRFGLDMGAFIPYIAGGVAFNETYVYNGGGNQFYGQTRRQTGLTLGAGLDWKTTLPITGNVVVRGEYLYDAYPGQSYISGVGAGTIVSVKSSAHYFRIALIDRIGDTPSKAPAVSGDWNGAYGGILAGGFSARPTTSGAAGSSSLTASSGGGGIYMGRNFQFGALVLGIDSATMLTDAKATSNLPGAAAGTLSYRNYIQADIRGRVGYAFDRFLPFFAVGVSFGRSEQRDPITGSERGRIPTEAWTLGGGLDYKLSNDFSVRGEYLYERDLRSHIVALDAANYSSRRTAQTFRAGLAYHFH